jgi:hypothetical protein
MERLLDVGASAVRATVVSGDIEHPTSRTYIAFIDMLQCTSSFSGFHATNMKSRLSTKP